MLSLLPHLLTLITSLALCLYAWQRQHVPGARPFAVITASQTMWMFGLIQELTVASLPAKLFWDHFQWIGSFGYALGLLAFVLETGQRRLLILTWKWALALVPLALFWLAGFNPAWLVLITPGAEIIPAQPFDLLTYPFGALHIAISVYLYLMFFISMGLGIRYWRRANPLYHRQLRGLFIGALLPFVASVLGLSGILTWFGQRDINPYFFAVSDLIFILSVFGYRIFDLSYQAYETIFKNLRDPVLVFGSDGILNSVNPAANHFLELTSQTSVGHHATEIFSHYPELLRFIESQQEGRQRIQMSGRRANREYELVQARLQALGGHATGWILIFHEIASPQDDSPLQRFTVELDHRQVQQAVFAEMTARFNAAAQPTDVLLALWQALDNLQYDTFSVWKRQAENLVWDAETSHLPGWLSARIYEVARRWANVENITLSIPLEQDNLYTRCYHTQTLGILHSADDLLNPIFTLQKNFSELPTWLQAISREVIIQINIQEHYVFPLGQFGIAFLNSSVHSPSIGQTEWVQLVCQQAGVALDRLLATEAYQALNAELEQRVQARTAQLEAANRELESFAYSVSHDLRAPLRAMSGFSNILATEYSEQFDEQGSHLLRRIQEAAERMNNLIEALLNLSRLTRSRMQITTVNLYALASEIADRLHQSDPQRQAEWHIQDGLSAQADQNLMCAVLENLLSNAWKFTSQRECTRIEVGCLTLTDGQAAFYVRDNGTGFDMAYADKLFTAFQRLHSEQEFEGTGIGLTTVQRIIHRHGGRIWPEAAPGQGATFYFTLST